ncbi:MAG: hypothetical protein DI568_06385 [Sphingomonas sp.]|nr:MAG: hypothetical protein DI568_06385 [Sphingomonas sp.]
MEGPLGPVSLEPRIMQLLVALHDADGDVAPRALLAERCWPGLLVGEDSLHRAVAGLRRALREVGTGRVRVETVSKVGYRLVAEGEPAGPRVRGADEVVREAGLSRRWLLGGAVAAAAAAAGWIALRPGPEDEHARLVQSAAAELAGGGLGSEGRARGLLEQAIGLQPDNAASWGLLAIAWQRIAGATTAGTIADAEAHAREAAKHALALDRTQGDAHVALALLKPMFGDWQTSEQLLTRAMDISPGNAHGLAGLAQLTAAVGRSRDSLALADRLAAEHPDHRAGPEWRVYGLWTARGAKAALAEAEVVRDRSSAAMQVVYLLLLAFTGRAAEAETAALAVQSAQQSPSHILTAVRQTVRAIGSGLEADAGVAEAELLRIARLGGSTRFVSLLGLGGLDRRDAAFRVAEEWYGDAAAPGLTAEERLARRHRTGTMVLFLPPLAAMRADARFLPLCDRIGLSAYWRAASQRPDFLAGQYLPL